MWPGDDVLALLLVAAFAAGWLDAVVGGGGLIQIPALVLALPSAAPVQILATNKIAAVWGTTLAAVLYARRLRPDPRVLALLCAAAGTGSAVGAALAGSLPTSWFAPVVLVLVVPVAVLLMIRPELGTRDDSAPPGPRRVAVPAVTLGLLVGAWDGLFGPGTGTLFTLGLVLWAGLPLLRSSGLARAANATTNVVAIIVLSVLLVRSADPAALGQAWSLGLVLAVTNLAGGWFGARSALARGSRFVRLVLLVVVGALCGRLAWELLA
jgi:hypothetical protein